MSKSAQGAGYNAPSHKSTIGGKGASAPDKAGVGHGLSERADVDSKYPMTAKVSGDGSHAGFASERLVPRGSTSAKSKGKSFNIEC